MTFREIQFRIWCALFWAVIFFMAVDLLVAIAMPGTHECVFRTLPWEPC